MVGAAFSTMLPIIGVVAAIAAIDKLIEKHDAAKAAMVAFGESAREHADAQEDFARKTEIANLRLEDQIAKLEGRPARNGVAIALLEVQTKVVELTSTYEKEFDKQDAEIAKQEGLWTSLKEQMGNLFDTTPLANLQTAKDKLEGVRGVAAAADETLKHAAAGTKEWGLAANASAVAQGNLAVAYDALATAQRAANADPALYAPMDAAAKTAKHNVENLKNDIVNAHLEIKKATETDDSAAGNDWFEKQRQQAASKMLWAKQAQKTQEDVRVAIEKDSELTGAADLAVQEEITKGREKQDKERMKDAMEAEKERAAGVLQVEQMSLAQTISNEKFKMEMRGSSARAAADAEINAVQRTTALELSQLDKQISDLKKADGNHLAEIQKLVNDENKIRQKGATEIVSIEHAAELKQEKDLEQYEKKFNQTMAHSILYSKNLGQAMKQMSGQMVEKLVEDLMLYLEKKIGVNAMILAVENAMGIQSAAQKAARAAAEKAINVAQGTSNAGVAATSAAADAGPAAPAVAAAVFASVEPFAMMFHGGGLVPGSGYGDTVPAMLSPGETVVSAALTDQVRNSTTNNRSGD